MAIVANLTTITRNGSSLGCIRSFSAPVGAVKEVDVTCLDSTVQTFIPSTLGEALEFTATVLFENGGISAGQVVAGTDDTFVITFPDTTTITFDGFVRDAGTIDGDASSDAPLEQTITIRLTTLPA